MINSMTNETHTTNAARSDDRSTLLTGVAIGAVAAAAAAAALFLRSRSRSVPARGVARSSAHGVDTTNVFTAGNVAVITGAGSGIGRETARQLAALGMKLVLADIDEADLESAKEECNALADGAAVSFVLDVSDFEAVLRLKQFAFATFGAVHFLMNNAAVQTNGKCGPYEHMDRWQRVLAVNLMGPLNGVHAFSEAMIAQDVNAVIVNTGSKQGITFPPGDSAYNVSKAGVKALTEALQHKLRNVPECKVNAFLLVPGWTITMISTKGKRWLQGDAFDPATAQDERSYDGLFDPDVARQKLEARGAWPASKTVSMMIESVRAGKPFYIICPDNETSKEMDDGRMQWAADDLILRRPPLSRWHAEYKEEYKEVSSRF